MKNCSINKAKEILCIGIVLTLTVIAVLKMTTSLQFSGVNFDASYYLGVSRLILEGKIPFVDFSPGYTPLSFYIMAIPIAIFGKSFTTALSVLYIFYIVNTYILYKIIKQHSGTKLISLYCSILSLVLCLGTGGNGYILEPFVLFFGLSALYVLKKGTLKWIIISGFLCFCSFWSKQYGLGFICLAIAALFLEEGMEKSFLSKVVYLLMGFFGGMVLFVMFFFLQGVDFLSLLSLSGNSYERDGIVGLIGGWISLFITLPLLMVALLVMIVKIQKAMKLSLMAVSFLGVFGFMLQCYVRFYAHYLMLAMPFAVLMLYACANAFNNEKLKNVYMVLLFLSSVIPIYFASKSIMAVLVENAQEKQKISAKVIEEHVPRGSKDVFCAMDLLPYMHLNTYTPPLIKKYGMSNGFVRKSKEVSEMVKASTYCMISERDFEKKKKYTEDICKYLDSHFFKIKIEGLTPQETYYIYVRKN